MLFASASIVAPRVGHAQVGSVPRVLAGAWAHDGDLARAVSTVDRAFASTIATLPELLQGFARRRVRSSMAPPRRVEIALEGTRIRVRLDAEHTTTIEGTLGGEATTTGVDDGTRVTSHLEGGWLELLYEGEGSEMRQLFSTEADGSRMHLDHRVTGGRVAGVVRYRLEYVHP